MCKLEIISIYRNVFKDYYNRKHETARLGRANAVFPVRWYPSGEGAVSVFGLPFPRHEFVDAVDLVIGQALEDPCQPCFGVDIVHLGGLDERVGDGGCFSAADGPHEQVILAAEANCPFILPMSEKNEKSITDGIPILAEKSVSGG